MRIEHVALYVNDLENTKKFFMKSLMPKVMPIARILFLFSYI